MNKWNEVEKRKRVADKSDLQWVYIKMSFWIICFLTYFYFLFK